MDREANSESPVTFRRHGALAQATLNLPRALNALNLEMIDLLSAQLEQWAQDDSVACVWIDGSGDKAFCAGGDVVALYRESASYAEAAAGEARTTYTTDFFAREYRLDHRIHTYEKPIVVWGGGYVMGGGIGIMAGASHRVVTPSTRMAMPEVTIGLFPDVGSSWFLNRMPGRLGLFLGLTGAQFGGSDALFAGMADRMLADGDRQRALEAVAGLDFFGAGESTHQLVSDCLKALQLPPGDQPSSSLREHYDIIQQLTDYASLPEVYHSITGYDGDDAWLQKAARTLAAGSPMTPWIVWEQLHRARHLSLADVFRMELALAVNLCNSGHFREGVRALLVDKDRNPAWQPPQLEEVPVGEAFCCFRDPWPQHPLRDL
ncbi:enoyl-CoA hydratase/isomerase family protein [Microbulbifer yueqingensis]|uniref:3-hydroxyisobutyryl-CoA hydrolase n=1 Tax=Microbulbifer yueqingensis TaxID=658219 RepID=A0A1G8Y019_9GAMM|nr:enoyl-CoA hydratase/isomerase family protein [Microbulbifer yueqingensis]SDJ96107.1 Enoyl-CoA hydratase/carnithine racemase [Microbulbifer yueqingensis]